MYRRQTRAAAADSPLAFWRKSVERADHSSVPPVTAPASRGQVPEDRVAFNNNKSDSLQASEVEREDQWEKRLEQTEEGMVVDMPRPSLRHRSQSAGIVEGDALGTGRDFVTPLRRAGNRVEPIERAPVPIAARDP